jgi:hypothetical protein
MTNENPAEAAFSQPHGVHLVGSVPLANAEEVFRTTTSILGERLRRIPDGETGVRINWIGWQSAVFANNPSFEYIPPDPNAYAVLPRFKLRSPMDAGDIQFNQLGYADAAIASYALFSQLKQAGIIPAHFRFQVSLPTPLAPVTAFVAPGDQAAVEPAYEAGMFNELDRITTAIPQDELAIQWDVAVEFGLLELAMPAFFADVKAGILERLIRLGNRVPASVELGYHLCYGDAEHKHFKQPEDTSKLVEVANAISAGVTRTINWIHMPVPRDRSDDAYFAPLRNLKLHPETELYLGLVHFTDGVEGTRQRIATAVQYVPTFGVATECGLGRRPPETIADLLRIHSEVASSLL